MSAIVKTVAILSAIMLGPTLCHTPVRHEEGNGQGETSSSETSTASPTSSETGSDTGSEGPSKGVTEPGGQESGGSTEMGSTTIDGGGPDGGSISNSSTGSSTTEISTSEWETTMESQTSVCGNGVQDVGELCDDCNVVDGDCADEPVTACLYLLCGPDSCLGCLPAACGDGVRNQSNGQMEECDDGNLDEGDACDKNCRREFVAFVTAAEYTSDLRLADWSSGYESSLSGVEAADDVCLHAAATFLPSLLDGGEPSVMVRAWIAHAENAESAPAVRFAEKIRTSNRIVRRDGKQFAAGWEALINGALDNALELTEYGLTVGDNVRAWTNVTKDGVKGTDDCWGWGPWNNIFQKGQIGKPTSLSSEWTIKGTQTCMGTARLYCFTQ